MDVIKSSLRVGDKVRYQSEHFDAEDRWENGIVKEIPEGQVSAVRVVYHCAGDWGNFMEYTSALTNLKDLKIGWRHLT